MAHIPEGMTQEEYDREPQYKKDIWEEDVQGHEDKVAADERTAAIEEHLTQWEPGAREGWYDTEGRFGEKGAYIGDDPLGDPLDREWPGAGGTSIKPYKYGYYKLSAEVRFANIMNSWIMVNEGIAQWRGEKGIGDDGKFFRENVTDDMLVFLAWGANDTDALEVGRQMLIDGGAKDTFYDWMVGEGRNDMGWARINGGSAGLWTNDSFGALLRGDLRDVEHDGAGFINRHFFNVDGTIDMFQSALDGGNMTEDEQKLRYAGEFVVGAAVDIALIYGVTSLSGGYLLGPSLARLGKGGKTLLTLLSGFKGSRTFRIIGGVRTATFTSTLGLYSASIYLGLTGDLGDEAALIAEAVEKGELSAEIANQFLQTIAAADPSVVFDSAILEADWYVEATAEQLAAHGVDVPSNVGAKQQKENAMIAGQAVSDTLPMTNERGTWNPVTKQMETMTPQPVGQTTTTTSSDEPVYESPLDDAISAQAANEPATTEEALGRYADSKKEIQAIRTQKQATVVGGMDFSVGVQPTASPSVYDVYRGAPGFNPGLIRGLREAELGRKPTYFEKDWAEIMGDWSIDKIKFFQDQAVRGGMINPEDSSYKYGQRDYITVQAFGQLLTDANNNGNFWEDQLEVNIEAHQQWLKENPDEEEKYPSFVTPTYLAPDYATLAQETKNTFNSKLRRRATKAEMNLFTDHLRDTDQQEWAANTQGLEQTHAARAREFESEEPESGGTVQDVDSIARFNEFFDEKFQGEIAHRERVDQVKRKQGGLFTSLNRIAGNI